MDLKAMSCDLWISENDHLQPRDVTFAHVWYMQLGKGIS